MPGGSLVPGSPIVTSLWATEWIKDPLLPSLDKHPVFLHSQSGGHGVNGPSATTTRIVEGIHSF